MKIEFPDYKSSDVLTTDVNFYNSGFFRAIPDLSGLFWKIRKHSHYLLEMRL
jgi:hypothetical protein